jgi:error-prone DNA polymerase
MGEGSDRFGPPSRDLFVTGGTRGYVSPGARKEKLRKRSFAAAKAPGPRYVELRCASAFSFLNGASLPEDLVERAAALGLPAVALVDANGLSGAPRFWKAAKAAGLKALVGAEVTLAEWPAAHRQRSAKRTISEKARDREKGPPAGGDATRLPDERPAAGEKTLAFDARRGAAPPDRRREAPRQDSRLFRGPLGLVPPPPPPGTPPPRLTLLAESRTGYRNLCRLLTAGALGKPKGEAFVTWDQVAAHAEGLHVLTGGEESPVHRVLASRGPGAARRLLSRLMVLFPGRVHVEVQRHGLREEEHVNRALAGLANSLKLPLLATNGVRYARRQEKELHDALSCLRLHTTLDGAGARLQVHRERHLKGAAEMALLFGDLPEALENAAGLAGRLDFTLADLGYRFPDYPLPPGETPASYLRRVTWEGARVRFRPLTARAQAQLEKELNLIEKLDLPGYFLIVWDIVRFCQRERILVQGRGSAANSAVCYALSITAVDPVKMDLLFERFLSEERGEWPDIDLDLPSGDQREKVIQHVYGRYGAHGAGMTANVITYRDRSAAREMAKVLGFSGEQIDTLAKTLGTWSFGEYRDPNRDVLEELASAGFDPGDPRVGHFARLFVSVQNRPRHLGQHSGGIVVAQGRLDEVVPLEPAAMEGRVVIQWDKDDCADLGIVKVDLLGLGMLAAIERMIPMIREHEGVDVDLAHLPPDDPAVYRMLNEADTVGVFQVESRAQMASLPRNAPRCFYDLVIQVAIIRPGPIVGGMVHPFFDRRQGRAPVVYAHPSLGPILKRTLGVPLFQEQLLRIAMVAAGFTGGEAEELRRAMGFKRSAERMAVIEKRLRDGMAARGITGEAQDQIVRSITSFALYGFPESHAASFALIAYASAWLKAHHPAAFLTGILNAWPMGFYHPATLLKDAERHGVTVLPIDVGFSGWECRLERIERNSSSMRRPLMRPPEDPNLSPAEHCQGSATAPRRAKRALDSAPPGTDFLLSAAASAAAAYENKNLPVAGAASLAVRLGLRFLKGLSEKAGKAIESECARRPFADVTDLARRCALHADELDRLAWAGALSSLGLTRREAMWQVADVGRRSGPLYESLPPPSRSSPLPAMSALEETEADYDATGMTAGPHLLTYLRGRLRREGVLSASELSARRDGDRVRAAGAVIVRQRPGTAKGFVFLSLEDESGIVQAIVRPDLFRENRPLIVGSPGLVVEGRLQRTDGTLSVRADRFWPLPSLPELPSHDFR